MSTERDTIHEGKANSVRPQGTAAVVTGAASGIGHAITVRLLKAGYSVVAMDVDEAGLSGAAHEFERAGRVSLLHGDVADDNALERAADAAEALSPLRVWVNNAGYNIISPIHQIDRATYDRGMAVVFGGVFWGTAIAVRHMLKGGGGSIINMSSIQGLVGFKGFPAYAAAKAGIIGLTRQVAAEYAGKGIRCNAIAPGVITTPLQEQTLAVVDDPDALRRSWDILCPIGRWGLPNDVAEAALFLASDSSAFMTGQVLVLDGGATVLARGE
ncbi:MAG: SDR family oxidoreductase [Chloroflexota bacterium]